jgi:hypothetical protein
VTSGHLPGHHETLVTNSASGPHSKSEHGDTTHPDAQKLKEGSADVYQKNVDFTSTKFIVNI